MKIKIANSNNEKLANVKVTFIIQDKHTEYTSDKDGVIVLPDTADSDLIQYYVDKNDIKKFKFVKESTVVLTIDFPTQDMLFVVSDYNAEPAIETTIVFDYLGSKLTKISNSAGEIKLQEIPENTEIKSYQVNHNKELINEQKHVCKQNINQYSITLEKIIETETIKLKLINADNEIIANTKLKFKVGGNEFDKQSNEHGLIHINNVKLGNIIEYKQINASENLAWQQIAIKENIKEYTIACSTTVEEKQSAKKTNSKSKMKFTLVDSNSHPIVNAVVCIEVGEYTRNKYTNQYGEITSDELQIGDKLKVSVDVKGEKISKEYFCQGVDENHKIVLKTNKNKFYVLSAVLLLVALSIVLYVTSNAPTNRVAKDEEIPEKDTLIISNYYFKLNEKANQEPIENGAIKLIYADTILEGITDKNGVLTFKSIENKIPTKLKIEKLGFSTITENYTLDSVFTFQMNTDSLISIDGELYQCNDIVKSDNAKINYHSFKMQKEKGRFRIWFNFFSTLHNIKVYKGGINNVSDNNLIYDSKKSIKGIFQCPYINYDTKDGIITVCITSDDIKPHWVYKVFCARTQTTINPKPKKPINN